MHKCLTAIVTGGTRRVGRWVSEALLVEGHDVHALYRDDASAAAKLTGEMAGGGYALHTHAVDATDEHEARETVERIASDTGGLGIVVNCMGPAASGSIIATPSAGLEQLWRGNVLAAHNVITAAVPYLRLGGGRIVNFLSIGVDTGKAFREVPLYAACKSMLLSYSRSLARELAPAHITVNCIALGVTDLQQEGAPGYDAEDLPMGRTVSQEDVAAAIWYLAGPGAAHVTGTVVNLSGGFGL